MPAAVWRRALESMSTAVVVLDRGLEVAALNPAAETLLRTSAKRSVGLPLARVAAAAADGGACEELLGRAVESRRACTGRNLRLGGQLVDCTATPLDEEDGGGAVLELANVEHYRRMSHEGRLLTQSESMEAVVRGLAHEVRNPLGGLRGAAQLLERELAEAGGGPPPDELREYTGIIVAEADRLSALVDRLLAPAAAPAKRGPVNVHRVTERVRALVEAEAAADAGADADAGAGAARVERDYDPSIPPLDGDFDQLVQAVLNVVRNAVQSGAGRIRIRTRVSYGVHIGPRQHPLAARIDVTDDGPGVRPDLAESAFFPMVSGRADGSGLGLPIAQSLVSRHGGVIEHAREGAETVFSIVLPIPERG